MKSLILSTAAKYLLPMLLLFSAYLLLRGHDMPGGGFTGGLVAAAGFSLHGFAFGMSDAKRLLPARPLRLVGAGLLLVLGSGVFAMMKGDPFLTGTWTTLTLPGPGEWKIGTPLLFDLGVFLVVIGATLAVLLGLGRED